MKISPTFCYSPVIKNEKQPNKQDYSYNKIQRSFNSAPSNSLDFMKTLQRIYKPLISFGAVIIGYIDPSYRKLKDELQNELEIFSGCKDNATLLGKGVFGEAYSLDKFPDIVIKQAFNKQEDFIQEEKNLTSIPKYLKVQKFVARAYDDIENRYYLLSTKVNGKSPDPKSNPWTVDHLKDLFETFNQLDQKGIYHGDLNNGNIKLTENGQIRLLDFQWTIKQNTLFSENERSITPGYMLLENAQMFEMAAIPDYITKIGDRYKAKEFFKTYIKEKSKYHKDRYDFIKNYIENSYNYSLYNKNIKVAEKIESAKGSVFSNPTDDILKTEAKKIQFLSAFREAYKCIDQNVPNKNIIPASASYLITMSAIQDFKKQVLKEQESTYTELVKIIKKEASIFSIFRTQTQKDQLDLEKRNLANKYNYYNMQELFANYWFDKLSKWTKEAFEFELKNANQEFSKYDKDAYYDFENPNVNLNNFGSMTNILSVLGEDYNPYFSKNFSIKENIKESDIEKNDKLIKSITKKVTTSDILEIKAKANEIEKTQIALQKAYQSERAMDVLNLSILGLVRSKQLSELTKHKYDNYSQKAYTTANELTQNYTELAQNTFNQIYNDILKDNASPPEILTGYKNMGNFYVKI